MPFADILEKLKTNNHAGLAASAVMANWKANPTTVFRDHRELIYSFLNNQFDAELRKLDQAIEMSVSASEYEKIEKAKATVRSEKERLTQFFYPTQEHERAVLQRNIATVRANLSTYPIEEQRTLLLPLENPGSLAHQSLFEKAASARYRVADLVDPTGNMRDDASLFQRVSNTYTQENLHEADGSERPRHYAEHPLRNGMALIEKAATESYQPGKAVSPPFHTLSNLPQLRRIAYYQGLRKAINTFDNDHAKILAHAAGTSADNQQNFLLSALTLFHNYNEMITGATYNDFQRYLATLSAAEAAAEKQFYAQCLMHYIGEIDTVIELLAAMLNQNELKLTIIPKVSRDKLIAFCSEYQGTLRAAVERVLTLEDHIHFNKTLQETLNKHQVGIFSFAELLSGPPKKSNSVEKERGHVDVLERVAPVAHVVTPVIKQTFASYIKKHWWKFLIGAIVLAGLISLCVFVPPIAALPVLGLLAKGMTLLVGALATHGIAAGGAIAIGVGIYTVGSLILAGIATGMGFLVSKIFGGSPPPAVSDSVAVEAPPRHPLSGLGGPIVEPEPKPSLMDSLFGWVPFRNRTVIVKPAEKESLLSEAKHVDGVEPPSNTNSQSIPGAKS